jgi:multidrug efflux system membrane fusion protein
MARRFSTKSIVVVIAVIVIGYYAYGRFFGHGGGYGQMGGAPPVSVAEVIERDVRQWNEFSGKLVAVDQVEIRPRVSGTIESIHFDDGAMVGKGDLLFVIDPRPYEAAFQSANALWILADADLRRAKSLLESKSIPQRDYDQRRNAAEVAKANFIKAKLDLEYTTIKSPITGRASRAEITAGNLVEAGMGQSPLLTTIVSSTPIYADFEIDEATFLSYAGAGVTNNQSAATIPVTLSLDGLPRAGHVSSFDNRVNNASGTVRVRAIFDNADGALVSGLFVRVKIGSPVSKKSLLITDRAIGTDQNKKFVLVVGAENKTEHRDVKLGGVADGLRVVEEGLKAGEKIIVSGLQRVMMPNQQVTPEIVPMDGAGAAPSPATAPKE